MPPKATNAEIDAKLDELRQFVRDQRETLSARRATTLVKSFRLNLSAQDHATQTGKCRNRRQVR